MANTKKKSDSMRGLHIALNETESQYTTDDGATFTIKRLLFPTWQTLLRANILDERQGVIDTISFQDHILGHALVGWSNVYDFDSKKELKFDKTLIRFLPSDLKKKLADIACEYIEPFIERQMKEQAKHQTENHRLPLSQRG